MLLSLEVALLILARPALIALIGAPLLVYFLKSKPRPPIVPMLVAVTLGMLPLVAWMVFNYWRLDRFTVTPAGGHPRFHLGSLLGIPKPRAEDPPQFKKFIELFAARRPEASTLDIELSNSLHDGSRFQLYLDTTAEAMALRPALSSSWLEFYEILSLYGERARQQFPERYLIHLRSGLMTLVDTVPCAAILVLLWSYARYRGRHCLSPYLACAMLLLLLHGAVVASLVVITPMNLRYYTLTLAPLLLTMLWCLAGLRSPHISR